MKRCNVCGQNRSLADYSKRAASKDGLSYTCRACAADRCNKRRKDNPSAFSDWYKKNKDSRADYWQSWYEKNKEHRSETYAAWRVANKHIVNERNARRRAAILNATPSWADHDKIREFYALASKLTEQTGVKHEVDHIIPLQSKKVCGLHCAKNLQVITKEENVRKRNKMPERLQWT